MKKIRSGEKFNLAVSLVNSALDVFFPDNHIQGVLKWTNFVLNLSKHIEDIHEEMARHEQLCIPVSTEIKIPRGSSNINLGDTV